MSQDNHAKPKLRKNNFFKEIPKDTLDESQPTMRNVIIIIDDKNEKETTPKVSR